MASALNNIAWFYYKLGRAAEGLPYANQLVEAKPRNFNAHDTRGYILVALGRKQAAIRDFSFVLANAPRNSGAWRSSKRALNKLLGEK